MERKAVGKGYKKAGAPFGMFGMRGGLMNKKMHARAHERMGMGKEGDKEETKEETKYKK